MIALIYSLFGLLLFLSLLLAFPLLASPRQSLIASLDKQSWISNIKFLIYIIAGVLGLQLISSYLALRNSGINTAGQSTIEAIRAVEAERDVLLCVSVLVLLLLLGQLYGLLRDYYRLNVRYIAMEKQAKSASAAFINSIPTTTSDTTKYTSTAASTTTTAAAAADDKMAAAVAAVEKTAAIELRKKEASVVAITRQAEGVKEQYEKLERENGKLKSQLEDYELMFADGKKKRS